MADLGTITPKKLREGSDLALLDKFKKRDETPQQAASAAGDFTKMTIETGDLAKHIDKVAQEFRIPAKLIDFKILAYRTFYRKRGEKKFKEVKKEEAKRFRESKLLLDPDIEIRQQIRAELFKKEKIKAPVLKMVIGANKAMTKIFLTFKKQQVLQYSDTMERDILAEIDRKMARLGLLLGVFNTDIESVVSRVVSSVRVNKSVDEDIQVVLCEGIEAMAPTPARITYHYKRSKSEKLDDEIQVDYADRGYIQTVSEGDLILECTKATEGHIGRTCRGEVIPIPQPHIELSEDCEGIKIEEGIKVEEDGEHIRYIATRKGYVNEPSPNHFIIQDELVIDEVSFRTTGSIEAGEDKDVKIHIQTHDEFADSVGSGVRVETSELKTHGNVGSGAFIKAKIVEIGGQTHQTSVIEAGEATIQLHKGSVEAESVEIEILEGGKVVADTVRINKISGGEIHAKEVYIQSVLSNAIVTASHLIEIDQVEGNGNKFIIDPTAQRGYAQKVEKIEMELETRKKEVATLTQKIKRLRMKIHNEKETIDQINRRISELKEQGVRPPEALIHKLKEHQKVIKEHNLLLKELKDVKIEKERLKGELKDIQSSVFDAKVINHSIWKEFNEITFRILNPPIEATHLPKEGEMAEEITLSKTEEGEFILNRKGS